MKCPNCGLALDPKKTKEIHREVYYCGTDEANRISVACPTIRELKDNLKFCKEQYKEEEDW